MVLDIILNTACSIQNTKARTQFCSNITTELWLTIATIIAVKVTTGERSEKCMSQTHTSASTMISHRVTEDMTDTKQDQILPHKKKMRSKVKNGFQ